MIGYPPVAIGFCLHSRHAPSRVIGIFTDRLGLLLIQAQIQQLATAIFMGAAHNLIFVGGTDPSPRVASAPYCLPENHL